MKFGVLYGDDRMDHNVEVLLIEEIASEPKLIDFKIKFMDLLKDLYGSKRIEETEEEKGYYYPPTGYKE